MPRVHTRTRKRAEVKRPMRCSAYPCKVAAERDGDTEIRVGDSYFTWARKSAYGGTTYFRHTQCGGPKLTDLTSRKTAQIDEAVSEAVWDFSPTVDEDGAYDGDMSDVTSVLESIAEVARNVVQEYQDSYDNLPENFQYGPTGEALESVAQELESWADDLESFDPSVEYEQPEREEEPDGEEDDESYIQRCQDALDTWASDVISEAQDAASDHPEYEG
jgi:hypothetical protein